jgi:serine/threonine-protein kinase
MTELSDPRLGILLDGRYRLDQRLAAGGMGVVYKGELVAIGKPVAIKFLHEAFASVPELVKRFQREAAAMSKLQHPHLVSVLDYGLSGGVPYLVMDFHVGRSLGEVLEHEGAMAPGRAVGIARQILAGVKHAHSGGVVHRDLKPDNIMLLGDVEGDFVKVLDFGLAKMVAGSGDAGTQLTNTGFALGTPGYMSPEQARGTETDVRSDLYSVGVILYHMIVGRKPFVADSPLAVLRMHMDDAPMAPRKAAPQVKLSADLERVILRAMAKEPSARWQTAGELQQALAATPEGGTAEMPIADREEEGSRTSVGRRRAPTAARRRWGPWLRRGFLLAFAVTVVSITWSHLSKRAQLKVRREFNDVAKVAEGAWNATQKDKSSPPSRAMGPAPKASTPSTPDKPAPAKPAPTPTPSEPPSAAPSTGPSPSAPSSVAPPNAPQFTPPSSAPDDEEDDDLADEPLVPSDTPGAKLEEAARQEPPPTVNAPAGHAAPAAAARAPTLQDAERLIGAGHFDEAVRTLYAVRRHSPRSAAVALLLGHAYFHKMWRTDGLREYYVAMRLSPSLRYNKTLQRNVVSGLEDPTYRLARAVIKTRMGVAVLGEVRRAAHSARTLKVRQRAAKLAWQLTHRRRRR